MKSVMLGLVGALVIAAGSVTTASAADIFVPPPFEPEVMPPALTWTGPYVGFNAGYFWSETAASGHIPEDSLINPQARALAEAVLDGNLDGDGFTGGLTLGFNHQLDSFVLGIEGDVNFLDLNETRERSAEDGGIAARARDEIDGDFLATLRLRLGLPVGQTLFYITGGGAYTDARVKRRLDWGFIDNCPDVGDGFVRCHAGNAKFDLGWVAGGGIEHAFDHGWSIKVEYLYADFGKKKFTTVSLHDSDQVMNHSFNLNMHIVRAGLNLHF